jgi:6-phosphofructokinase 1
MAKKMKNIGVFTSGGDSPGMNACIRAVVRTGIYEGLNMFGIYRGYDGMIEGEILPMDSRSVSNIIQRGGTILKSARSEQFMTVEGRKKAARQLKKNKIDGIIAIGGNGTFTGAEVFRKEHQIPCIGIPGTIDNDLYGTDFTLGFDTAVNTAMQAIDKIRDTADSHNRLFFIEVMGRDAGFIATWSGLASGAEAILVPEIPTYMEDLIEKLETGWKRQKTSSIIIVAEGDDAGGAYEIAKKVKEKFNQYEIKVSILGHIQRGGSPTCFDRVLGGRLGAAAVQALLAGRENEMAGIVNGKVKFTPFSKAIRHKLVIQKDLLDLGEMLAT